MKENADRWKSCKRQTSFILFCLLILLTYYCQPEEELSGEALARIHCGTCHIFPDPSELDSLTWANSILPRMGYRFGIDHPTVNPKMGKSLEELMILDRAGIYPQKPILALADWEKIKAYYQTNAPQALEPPMGKVEPQRGLPFFEPESIKLYSGNEALTTMLKYNVEEKKLYVGDGRNELYILGQNHRIESIVGLHSPAVDIVFGSNTSHQVLSVGIIFPTESSLGRLQEVDLSTSQTSPLADSLSRPVAMKQADLNGDQLADLIVCHYGNETGRLVWYEQLADGGLNEQVISNQPGAIEALPTDFDRDGDQDIIALFAQGREGLWWFENDGKGRFKSQNLLELSPVWGSNSFALYDFNLDGHVDILSTNGDNADYSYLAKPYHGVRIYLNDGNNHFTESFFYPIHGASKAMASDFDRDGDLDIAVTAFFPDWETRPKEGFVYLENRGMLSEKFDFKPFTFEASDSGRWLVMEVADVNKDGRDDIIIGSFTYSSTPVPAEIRKKWRENGSNVVVLYNSL